MNWAGKSGGRTEEWWTPKSGGWATWAVLLLFLAVYGMRMTINAMKKLYTRGGTTVGVTEKEALIRGRPVGKLEIITETDLQKLVAELDEINTGEVCWEHVLEKRSENVAYYAKRRDPKNGGPTQYLSTTTFENCSTELLRDFFMDNEYRMTWDKTVVHHEQLEICEKTGVEIGRGIKKFPLMTPREYVLAWRIWEGQDKTFYCCIEACDHLGAPRQAKYKRVELYRSGWRIRKVPGRDACEISMWHQEDAGVQREMAKVAFTRTIWSYVCKMEVNLRKYALSYNRLLQHGSNAVAFAQKLPTGWDDFIRVGSLVEWTQQNVSQKVASNSLHRTRSSLRRSGRLLAKSFLLIGGAAVCTSGSAPMGAKLAVLCLLKKVIKSQTSVSTIGQQQVHEMCDTPGKGD